VDREWLDGWRVSVTAVLGELLSAFRQRYGFEPGAHTVGPPASREAIDSLAELQPGPARDLLVFYETIGEVSLPDVGNGYFIHSPGQVTDHAQAAEPRSIGPPFDIEVLAFASDGGGALYVLPAAEAGPVYRLRDCAIRDGVASARPGDVQIVAGDLRAFLQRLKFAVETFTKTGSLTGL
jgi:hypothetical protein